VRRGHVPVIPAAGRASNAERCDLILLLRKKGAINIVCHPELEPAVTRKTRITAGDRATAGGTDRHSGWQPEQGLESLFKPEPRPNSRLGRVPDHPTMLTHPSNDIKGWVRSWSISWNHVRPKLCGPNWPTGVYLDQFK
jgi:hypothetical protein